MGNDQDRLDHDTVRPETAATIAAMAHHARIDLDPAERSALEDYVATVWDMAERLRGVVTPGLEGHVDDYPKRAAHANLPDPRPDPNPLAAPPSPDQDGEMAADHLLEGDLQDLATAFATHRTTPIAIALAMIDRIQRRDGFVRSYVHLDAAGAERTARALTVELRAGNVRSLLHGATIGAKDSIPIAGMPCTYNSPLMRDWVPRRDAEAIRRLRAAGAILIGKHNLNEFGWSLPTEQDLTPPPRNPWFPEERSVGSTSGGGAAVAAGLAHAAIGTDGGGSIRLPAGQHLLVGVKPGHDAVPRQGVGEGTVSEVSVLARTASDAAAVLAVMQIDVDAPGGLARLRTEPPRRVTAVGTPSPPLRLGIPRTYLHDVAMEPDVATAFTRLERLCADHGHHVVDLPGRAMDILHDAVRANFVVIAAEHYFDHEAPGRDRRRYGPSAGFYNLPGAFLTAADYLHALRVGAIARQSIDASLGDVDFLLLPTSPVTRTSTARNPSTHRRGGNAAFTAPFNISGHPAISFPVGLSSEGIPIGAQVVGRTGSEFDQLRLAANLMPHLALPPFPDVDALVSDRLSR